MKLEFAGHFAAAMAFAVASFLSPTVSHSQVCETDDAVSGWSDSENPHGPWSWREGANPLPHVADWEGASNAWGTPQPGWADDEQSTSRLPIFFLSNGTETFAHDWQEGDLVVHTTDEANGIGNGAAGIVWTSPTTGRVDIAGAVWMGREIGRANHWSLRLNDVELTGGDVASGDQYSRSSPFLFALGSGGLDAIGDVYVRTGEEIRLVLTRTSQFGDFVGLNMEIACNEIFPDCGDATASVPQATAGVERAKPNATDALFVLKTAVQQFTCDLCVCDVNKSGGTTAADALLVLKSAVGTGALSCIECASGNGGQ